MINERSKIMAVTLRKPSDPNPSPVATYNVPVPPLPVPEVDHNAPDYSDGWGVEYAPGE